MTQRLCEFCGKDQWLARDYPRLSRENSTLRMVNREQTETILKLRLRCAELQNHDSFNSRKVRRQEKVIRRLEEKLKELKELPYEGFKLGET